jgi:DNA-directed RNA polymerase specialized sigma24 family protein
MVAGPEGPLLAKEALRVIARMKLSAGQREVVALVSLGYNGPEIAVKLGVPVATVFSWLKKVRAAYRRKRRG